ncbi:MAG: helix-turn-helix transcriptional regulator [Betaproteobacteria bacterium]|nr:helix-turn-helix transcriptional regulator [Betaproteobacteria bacterium]
MPSAGIGTGLHIRPGVELETGWLSGDGLPPRHGRALLALLAALSRADSLREAARAAGLSYRHAWGLVGAGSRALGAPLVDMQRGRGARLTVLGRRLLDADAHVRAALEGHSERLRREVRAMLAEALPGRSSRLRLRASHDLALPLLARLCAPRVELEIAFRGADECLASLARGECELAGFHVADALPRAAAAAAALGRWLEPRKHQLVHFVAREQGIIVRPGARIRGVHDLARPGVRFINRPPGAGTPEDVDLAIAAAVADGRADAGFGLRAAAARYALEFVPLATERYYLAASRQVLREAPMQALLGILRGRGFADAVRALPGYDASKAGTREALSAALAWLGRTRRARG